MEQYRVQRERAFHPHHILIGAANSALTLAKEKHKGWFYFNLVAITFSALALEALANSFGSRFIDRWEDYESSRPTAKLRVVCDRLGIIVDFSKDPWATVLWLITYRNKVAHAKPEMIKEDTVMTSEEYERKGRDSPESKLEKDTNLRNAERAVKAIEDIFDLLCEKIDGFDDRNLQTDGWSGSASKIEEA